MARVGRGGGLGKFRAGLVRAKQQRSNAQSSIVGWHLAKLHEGLGGAEFANLKVAGPADRYRTGMPESPPKPPRMLYRSGRT